MARSKQLTWSELRVGLFVLVGLLILAVAIFYVTGAGVWGPKVSPRTHSCRRSLDSPKARQFDLDGVEIGNVERIPGSAPARQTARQNAQHRDRYAPRPEIIRTIFSPIPRHPSHRRPPGQSLRQHPARLHRRSPQRRPNCHRRRRKSHQGSRRAQRRCLSPTSKRSATQIQDIVGAVQQRQGYLRQIAHRRPGIQSPE